MPILVKNPASSGFKFLSAAIITAITIGAIPTCIIDTLAVKGEMDVNTYSASIEITKGININFMLKPIEINLIMLLSLGKLKLQPIESIVNGVNSDPRVSKEY